MNLILKLLARPTWVRLTSISWTYLTLSLLISFLTRAALGDTAGEPDTDAEHSYDHEDQVSRLVESLLKRMDPRVRPFIQGPPVKVYVDCHVTTIGDFSEMSMDFVVDINFRQRWADPRLYYNVTDFPDSLTLTHGFMGEIWFPDTYFSNEKDGREHNVIVSNDQLKVYANGTVVHSLRLTLKLSCHMDLHYYPLDKQQCFLYISSFSYEAHELMLSWFGENPVTFDEKLRLPEMRLTGHQVYKGRRQIKIPGGEYDYLTIEFRLQREFMYHLLQSYIPSILIVILSWVSFWINMEAVPARVTLGVTAVLTMTAHLSGTKADHPKVSYLKASDVWSSACMVFVFLALIEYAVVNALMRAKGQSAERKQPGEAEDENRGFCGKICNCIRLSNRSRARQVDRISRILFPTSFVLFNAGYWIYYTTEEYETD